ncbi:hypothetical protein YC2023_043292 [Brassica napus]
MLTSCLFLERAEARGLSILDGRHEQTLYTILNPIAAVYPSDTDGPISDQMIKDVEVVIEWKLDYKVVSEDRVQDHRGAVKKAS